VRGTPTQRNTQGKGRNQSAPGMLREKKGENKKQEFFYHTRGKQTSQSSGPIKMRGEQIVGETFAGRPPKELEDRQKHCQKKGEQEAQRIKKKTKEKTKLSNPTVAYDGRRRQRNFQEKKKKRTSGRKRGCRNQKGEGIGQRSEATRKKSRALERLPRKNFE